ncbi:YbfB/YjiJ family MFS transporter [Paenarthrobacter sp. NPDC089316]|uniref:YbfB/YjiJ family MFS transporter n=1 Tax=unclassified Paenarthrobacter TaxID=2634190 RepID=UPI00344730BB
MPHSKASPPVSDATNAQIAHWPLVAQAAAALAAAMGIGRFVFTPILPLMEAQAGLTSQAGVGLATANYIGYLAGAVLGIVLPSLVRSQSALRLCLIGLVLSLALMPATSSDAAWFLLRLFAGAASALVFVIAVSAMLSGLSITTRHLAGWGFGGVGVGIALTGIFVAIVRAASTWQFAWWISAAVTATLAAAAWRLPVARRSAPRPAARQGAGTAKWFAALWASYVLEGIGYIIAGTFLVAAVQYGSVGDLGSGVWTIVGVTAIPSCALWVWLARKWNGPALLSISLFVQAIGIALPAVVDGTVAALVAAALFGATFMGVSALTLAIGDHLQTPYAVALLTVGFSIGQILGPLLAAPLIHNGFQEAMLFGGIIVLGSSAVAAVLCIRFPHRAPATTAP